MSVSSVRLAYAAPLACLIALAAVSNVHARAADHLLSRDDLKTVSDAMRLAGAGKLDAATQTRDHIRDPLGRKVTEWVILRSDGDIAFARYANFIQTNPAWPGMTLLQRRAEARLWIERSDTTTIRAFFAGQEPLTALGQLALARALAALGDNRAIRYASAAWRSEGFSATTEAEVLRLFGSRLTQADHAARMHSRLYANDFATAMRAAKHLGPGAVAIVSARQAVIGKSAKAASLLAAVPANVRSDPAYQFTRIQWLRRSGKDSQAAQAMLAAPRDPTVINSPDIWWVERRALVRSLLDDGKARLAYRLAAEAAPDKETYRVDRAFMAGWISLRFLRDAQTATRHFNEIPGLTRGPTALARAQYWLGRAAEAGRNRPSAQQHYTLAAQHGTTYYGQLACARIGCRNTKVRAAPTLTPAQRATFANRELVRAVEILYGSGNRRLVVPFVGDLHRSNDTALLAMVAESARQHRDPGAMLAVGRSALNRGLAFDSYAFPATGLPDFAPIGARTDKSLVYAITRTESAFNPRITSGAMATGYMQVTPAAGQTLARRMGFTFNNKRLHEDPAYNLQLGSAEIANLLSDYDGNHVLAFVGYNAGRGRVRQWIERYGDPRQANVDVVDWVERIPYAETRNYVQRVLENLQVYRSRFGNPELAIEAHMRGRQG
ncbi:lytic transglycosylase domain-containing protein [Tardiphaga alba]|uniref:Lytic transglycosylase domain-containing protein n=1 Tax=Tardiphaga alba TaxID=340268 RepID=A0ABX8AE27_9BRAD|nr:lytic transglycosylase domain-containing protein [Tardiphaga alba]QUS41201.1 lytic transglycosylase domain-containing protein [Tardiphaga alba]